MRYNRFRQYLFVCLSILVLASCSGYDKVLKSNDINYKLTKANEYYDKKQWMHASDLYQSILPMVKGTKNFEPMYYRYAYSHYYMQDYLTASYHFKNFVEQFPRSTDAEECQFMYALCLYKMSYKYSLEQTNTVKAMEALQMYINMYPNSKRITEANKYIDEGRDKLEKKDAEAAVLYYNISQYKAASVSFKNVIRTYPESTKLDYYQYMIVKSLYNYATESITEKQEERYNNAIIAYNDFKESYPKSQYLRDAEAYNAKAETNIKTIRK